MSSVDVIVPCYRYGHFLRECVKSVLAQSGPNVRVLIIDDASPDNTAEVAFGLTKEDSRVSFFRHATNQGHIATYNEGIGWASADYMLILSADDYLLPGALIRAASVMDENRDVGFIFGRSMDLDENGEMKPSNIPEIVPGKVGWRILTGPEFIEKNEFGNIVRTPTAVVRTALQKRIGGYRSELPHSGDLEMWFRLAAYSSVGFVNALQAVYRLHEGNMSKDYLADYWLSDIEQRKAAIDRFFWTCGEALEDHSRLRGKLTRSLGRAAVSRASAAFNRGDMEISRQLSDIAVDVCPSITRSMPWIKLACKRHVGRAAWRTLQPAVARMRHIVSRTN